MIKFIAAQLTFLFALSLSPLVAPAASPVALPVAPPATSASAPPALLSAHFDYTDAFAVIQHCDGTYDPNKITTQEVNDTVRLVTHKWESETPNFDPAAMCQATVLPPGPAQSPTQQMNAMLDSLRQRRAAIESAIDREIGALNAMKVGPSFRKIRAQRISYLKLQRYLAQELGQYAILSMTPQAKAKLTIKPLLKSYAGKTVNPICQMYAQLIPEASEKETEGKLDVLIRKHVQHWEKSVSKQVLESYKDVSNRKCALAWLFWNRCVTDQFGAASDFGAHNANPVRLHTLFQTFRCYTDQLK